MTGKEEKQFTQSPIAPPSWEEQPGVLISWTDSERPVHQGQVHNKIDFK